MAILSVLSVYFIFWAIFYIILAVKLDPRKVPSRALIKGAAIATLPLCLGIIPIIIDIEFWRMNTKLREYEARGAGAFISDEEYMSAEPKRKKGRVIAWSILLSVLALLTFLVIAAIATGGSSRPESSMTLAERAVNEVNSDSTFTLPKKIDDVTTLTAITSNGNEIEYHYRLDGADYDNLSDSALYDSIRPNVCSDTDTRELIDAGVTMTYLYEASETTDAYTVRVAGADCA
jgi:hypothetical protein